MNCLLAPALALLSMVATAAQAAELSATERSRIDDHIRACWPRAGQAVPADTRVMLDIVTNEDGTVVDATKVASLAKVFSTEYGPAQRALADQAQQAVLDQRCKRLPLPARLLGHAQNFMLTFGP